MATASRPVPASARMPWWIKVLIGILVGLVVISISAGGVLVLGRVDGSEFSPDTFAQRDFSFYNVPLLGVKVGPISRRDTTGPLANHLIMNKMIPTNATNPQWDMVTRATNIGQSEINDSQVLVDYLELSDSGGYPVWLRWTENHPEYAENFWPVVARLARGNLYVHLPRFFRLAREAEDPEQFKDDLQTAEIKLHQELGARWKQRGRQDLADAHLKAAASLIAAETVPGSSSTKQDKTTPEKAASSKSAG